MEARVPKNAVRLFTADIAADRAMKALENGTVLAAWSSMLDSSSG